MLDFMTVATRTLKGGIIEVYPKFIVKKSKDLMIRGGDFYAIWNEEKKMWSTDQDDVVNLIDAELDNYVNERHLKTDMANDPIIKYMWDSDSGIIDKWHKYCQKQTRDSYHMLDETLIFSNMEPSRELYASKRLNYPLEKGSITAYDKIIGTLYTEEERRKIEWAIGAVVSGDSKWIQKFLVFYGKGGTGKSTILNIIEQLFEGYDTTFDAKALGSANAQFALEPFTSNPLVAIQHDGDLSKIEDNTRLNSLVSHEAMSINEKYKKSYNGYFKCFCFMGTNTPVKITDGKSGLLRRLIDVHPSGNLLPVREYKKLTNQIKFELGAIAYHCLQVYKDDPGYFDDYVPIRMMKASNDFYNYVIDSHRIFKRENGTTLKAAWEMYKEYVESAKVRYPYSMLKFQEELRNYFEDFFDQYTDENGNIVYNYYKGFKTDTLFDNFNKKAEKEPVSVIEEPVSWLKFDCGKSIFDEMYSDCPAQLATTDENPKPRKAWADVDSKLSDIDSTQLHYVLTQSKEPNHIVVDFDIKDPETGKKSYELNLAAAGKWPATYAELSKSGAGIHLHYDYIGDVSKLSRIYDDNIEIKVFSGNSSLRRRLTKCNDLPISTISSGLPLKGDDNMINFNGLKSERALRTLIKRHLNKEIMGYTKSSIQMIDKVLNEAYESGIGYDVSDLREIIYDFALSSNNNAPYCIKVVNQMKFKSEEPSEAVEVGGEVPIVFYDVEVFPNLFLVNWKFAGEGKPVVRMINPSPKDIEQLIRYKLIGFNCKRYDNHMLWGCMMGYDNEQLYNLSQGIINTKKGEKNNNFFSEAYNLSYTDVYDYSAKKQSLKKWEIELGLKHHELGLPWDKPVPEEKWAMVAEYCDDDVLATEAVHEHLKGDFLARQILADLAGSTVNDSTNGLTTKIIFGKERKPRLVYTDLATGERSDGSVSPYKGDFPGYKFFYDPKDKQFHNMYRETDVGKGGYVHAELNTYGDVAILDVASMHPHSILAMNCFGEYTARFKEIIDARIAIKHKDFDTARKMLDGKLAKYLDDEGAAGDLAQALKIAINSVYGLTSASFPNPFKDERNRNNIVALRGALFMKTLEDEVRKRGYIPCHIKTDSIKIPDATPEIIDFVMNFGKQYGYTFEHEGTYEKMCLVNNSTYIAKYATAEKCEKLYGYIPGDNKKKGGKWTATAAQFQAPYVFKTLFSKEPIIFEDLCETKEVKTAMYLDMNENLPDPTEYEKQFAKTENEYGKGLLSDTTFESICAELNAKMEECHDRVFIGKVSNFCPIKPGCGGGELVRSGKDAYGNDKYDAVVGTKGYRWLEAEKVKELGIEDAIDKSYYAKLADEAVEAVSKYCDFEWFVSDEPYISTKKIPSFLETVDTDEVELPFL